MTDAWAAGSAPSPDHGILKEASTWPAVPLLSSREKERPTCEGANLTEICDNTDKDVESHALCQVRNTPAHSQSPSPNAKRRTAQCKASQGDTLWQLKGLGASKPGAEGKPWPAAGTGTGVDAQGWPGAPGMGRKPREVGEQAAAAALLMVSRTSE
jgi:hypothetical protein